MILALALACAPADSNSYEPYDPSAPVSSETTEAEAPVQGMREYSTFWLTEPAVWKAPKGGTVVAFSAPTTGRWLYPGAQPGVEAGEAACRALGATHVCTEDELQRADAAGETRTAPVGTTVWVAPHNRKDPNDRHGADTCGKYTYEGADAKWSGVASSYESTSAGSAALKVKHAPPSLYDPDCLKSLAVCAQVVPSGFECNDTRSIACCGDTNTPE